MPRIQQGPELVTALENRTLARCDLCYLIVAADPSLRVGQDSKLPRDRVLGGGPAAQHGAALGAVLAAPHPVLGRGGRHTQEQNSRGLQGMLSCYLNYRSDEIALYPNQGAERSV